MRTVAAIALAVLLGGLSSPYAQAADFAFRLEYDCGDEPQSIAVDKLDTFAGTFARRLLRDGSYDGTMPMVLSAAQMKVVADAVERIGFFDYPADVTGSIAGPGWKPWHSYRLEVRSAGRSHTVFWQDRLVTPTEQGLRLGEVVRVIVGFVEKHPDIKRVGGRALCE